MSGAVVAIGGGGFLMEDTRGLQERYLLSLLPQRGRAPRVLYLGTASGDGERAQLRFLKLFLALGCDASTLPFFPYEMKRDYAQAVRDADLVYVGGGNTVAMLAVWREFGFERALHAAWQAGTVLAGISAGANCWFERYVTDSVPGGGVREGLGWLPGTFCPHLDSEPWRQALVEAETHGPVHAAPDGVMVRFEGGRAVEAVTSRPDLAALQRPAAGAPLSPLPTRVLDGATRP
ncbi:peptidase E [Ramlibacter sp. XY19]|uniref:Type 1 glutamine amidotransferase-like domain-containing protein n=1 Tax=Ramlibacter paludis TaxID=2908000 RepID=UPI0023DC3FBF|nr:peptidase E [Ramlibacter paludis]